MMTKCPCGLAPVATASENKAAHDAGRCVKCYEIERYAELLRRRMLDMQSKSVMRKDKGR
jgi:hypothetical protein